MNAFMDWRIGPNIALMVASFWGYQSLKTGTSLLCLPFESTLAIDRCRNLECWWCCAACPGPCCTLPSPPSTWLLMLTFQTRSSLLSRGREQFCNWPSLQSCRWSWIQLKTLLFSILWYIPINEKGLLQIYFVVFFAFVDKPRCWSHPCWTGLGSPCAFALKHYDALYLVLWQHYDTPYLEHSVAAFRVWHIPPFSCVRESAFVIIIIIWRTWIVWSCHHVLGFDAVAITTRKYEWQEGKEGAP